MGELDNTLFFYIVGDNGSSAEGGPDGSYNEILALNGIVSDVSSQLAHIDEWGGPMTFPHFSIGWAHAGNTPFQWTKQVASHFGGTRNPMVDPLAGADQGRNGEVRSQFHHVIDVAPTVLEAAGLPAADDGQRHEAVARWTACRWSTRSTTPRRPDRRTTQYFEMFGNRAIYHDGWVAATRHSIPWLMVAAPALRPGPLGAVQRRRGLQPGQRPGGAEPAEAQGAAGRVRPGSDPQPRVPARRPPRRALRRARSRVGRTSSDRGPR